MITQTVTFKNFKGEERMETHYFHITKTSVLNAGQESYDLVLNLGRQIQDRVPRLEALSKKQSDNGTPNDGDIFDEETIFLADSARLMARLLESVVDMSYGILTDDGDRFIRSEDETKKFKQSMAYEYMVDKFMTNPDELSSFIQALMNN